LAGELAGIDDLCGGFAHGLITGFDLWFGLVIRGTRFFAAGIFGEFLWIRLSVIKIPRTLVQDDCDQALGLHVTGVSKGKDRFHISLNLLRSAVGFPKRSSSGFSRRSELRFYLRFSPARHSLPGFAVRCPAPLGFPFVPQLFAFSECELNLNAAVFEIYAC